MRNTEVSPTRLPFLSQTAEHALRAVLYLARRGGSELVPAKEIAAALGAPHNYLGKTLARLSRHGLLRSVRGPQGGFALAMDAAAISAATVVDAVDEPRPALPCLTGARPCDPLRPCAVHARWAALASRVARPLRDTSIADLLAETEPLVPNNTVANRRPEVTIS
jgi:Rrf2 family protein